MENATAQLNSTNFLAIILGYFPKFTVQGIIEIVVITYVIYKLLLWIRHTRGYALLRGVLIILIVYLLAYYFNFTAISFIIEKSANLAVIALIIIFQNDIRYILEHIGRSKLILDLFPDVRGFSKQRSEKTIQEIAKATFAMARVKTGALMVIEQQESLKNIEKTGIAIDGKVSSGLLVNIFEKNTPLHDGAVVIVGDKVKAATCYLPLSENKNISKDYGTRHRAALGMSEESDCQVVVVSEETGGVSLAVDGKLTKIEDEKELMSALLGGYYYNKDKEASTVKSVSSKIKGFFKYEERTK